MTPCAPRDPVCPCMALACLSTSLGQHAARTAKRPHRPRPGVPSAARSRTALCPSAPNERLQAPHSSPEAITDPTQDLGPVPTGSACPPGSPGLRACGADTPPPALLAHPPQAAPPVGCPPAAVALGLDGPTGPTHIRVTERSTAACPHSLPHVLLLPPPPRERGGSPRGPTRPGFPSECWGTKRHNRDSPLRRCELICTSATVPGPTARTSVLSPGPASSWLSPSPLATDPSRHERVSGRSMPSLIMHCVPARPVTTRGNTPSAGRALPRQHRARLLGQQTAERGPQAPPHHTHLSSELDPTQLPAPGQSHPVSLSPAGGCRRSADRLLGWRRGEELGTLSAGVRLPTLSPRPGSSELVLPCPGPSWGLVFEWRGGLDPPPWGPVQPQASRRMRVGVCGTAARTHRAPGLPAARTHLSPPTSSPHAAPA